MSGTVRSLLSLGCNVAIVVLTVVSVLSVILHRNEGEEKRPHFETFQYFTTDSNVLAALAALLMLPFGVRGALAGELTLPLWATLVKYVGTASVTVTFLTVMVFLGPTQGYPAMFAGYGLYMHLIGPLLAILSFCLLETGLDLTWGQMLLGLLPTFVYGTTYLVMAVKRGKDKGGWEDFYGFNVGRRWFVSYIAMHIGTLVICVGLSALHNLC